MKRANWAFQDFQDIRGQLDRRVKKDFTGSPERKVTKVTGDRQALPESEDKWDHGETGAKGGESEKEGHPEKRAAPVSPDRQAFRAREGPKALKEPGGSWECQDRPVRQERTGIRDLQGNEGHPAKLAPRDLQGRLA